SGPVHPCSSAGAVYVNRVASGSATCTATPAAGLPAPSLLHCVPDRTTDRVTERATALETDDSEYNRAGWHCIGFRALARRHPTCSARTRDPDPRSSPQKRSNIRVGVVELRTAGPAASRASDRTRCHGQPRGPAMVRGRPEARDRGVPTCREYQDRCPCLASW